MGAAPEPARVVGGHGAPVVERAADEVRLEPVTDRAGLIELQQAVEQVHVSKPVGSYIVDIVASTRSSRRVQVGASPRGSLALLKLSRCKAALAGRDFVTPDDVKALAIPIDSVFVSPMWRCRDTAQIAFGQVVVEGDVEVDSDKDPAAGDGGGAVGAALYAHHCLLREPRGFVMRHAYWGEEDSEGEIRAFLSPIA